MLSLGSQAYWDARFARDCSQYDSLLPAQVFRDIASECLAGNPIQQPEILHIGCGTSGSHVLRALVADPAQITNVDFSEVAIEVAARREQEFLEQDRELLVSEGDQDADRSNPERVMRWSRMDMTSLDAVPSLLDQQIKAGKLFDLVLDKSTSDSISCGPLVDVQLPYPLSINGWSRSVLYQSTIRQTAHIHPLHLLAVHLAALTPPHSGRWIAISFTDQRFPFLRPHPNNEHHGLLTSEVMKAGFPHPDQLWRLEKKEQIDLDGAREETLGERKKRLAAGLGRRSSVKHWLYVMVRTDVIVCD